MQRRLGCASGAIGAIFLLSRLYSVAAAFTAVISMPKFGFSVDISKLGHHFP